MLGFLTHEEDKVDFHKDFTDHHITINRLNNIDSKKWEAGYHEDFKTLSLIELNQRAGHSKFGFDSSISAEDKDTISKSRKVRYPEEYETDNVDDLPKQFDWKEKLDTPRE